MANSIPFAEIWRGEFLECVHEGDAVVCDAKGEIVHAWGDPEKVILPRSSCKIIQALPLVRPHEAVQHPSFEYPHLEIQVYEPGA